MKEYFTAIDKAVEYARTFGLPHALNFANRTDDEIQCLWGQYQLWIYRLAIDYSIMTALRTKIVEIYIKSDADFTEEPERFMMRHIVREKISFEIRNTQVSKYVDKLLSEEPDEWDAGEYLFLKALPLSSSQQNALQCVEQKILERLDQIFAFDKSDEKLSEDHIAYLNDHESLILEEHRSRYEKLVEIKQQKTLEAQRLTCKCNTLLNQSDEKEYEELSRAFLELNKLSKFLNAESKWNRDTVILRVGLLAVEQVEKRKNGTFVNQVLKELYTHFERHIYLMLTKLYNKGLDSWSDDEKWLMLDLGRFQDYVHLKEEEKKELVKFQKAGLESKEKLTFDEVDRLIKHYNKNETIPDKDVQKKFIAVLKNAPLEALQPYHLKFLKHLKSNDVETIKKEIFQKLQKRYIDIRDKVERSDEEKAFWAKFEAYAIFETYNGFQNIDDILASRNYDAIKKVIELLPYSAHVDELLTGKMDLNLTSEQAKEFKDKLLESMVSHYQHELRALLNIKKLNLVSLQRVLQELDSIPNIELIDFLKAIDDEKILILLELVVSKAVHFKREDLLLMLLMSMDYRLWSYPLITESQLGRFRHFLKMCQATDKDLLHLYEQYRTKEYFSEQKKLSEWSKAKEDNKKLDLDAHKLKVESGYGEKIFETIVNIWYEQEQRSLFYNIYSELDNMHTALETTCKENIQTKAVVEIVCHEGKLCNGSECDTMALAYVNGYALNSADFEDRSFVMQQPLILEYIDFMIEHGMSKMGSACSGVSDQRLDALFIKTLRLIYHSKPSKELLLFSRCLIRELKSRYNYPARERIFKIIGAYLCEYKDRCEDNEGIIFKIDYLLNEINHKCSKAHATIGNSLS